MITVTKIHDAGRNRRREKRNALEDKEKVSRGKGEIWRERERESAVVKEEEGKKHTCPLVEEENNKGK